jgi:hypothetical protein
MKIKQILSEVSSNKSNIYGVHSWSDPNMGWGFGRWVEFVSAKSLEEVEKIVPQYNNMGYNITLLKSSEISNIKKDLNKKIKECNDLLKKINSPKTKKGK